MLSLFLLLFTYAQRPTRQGTLIIEQYFLKEILQKMGAKMCWYLCYILFRWMPLPHLDSLLTLLKINLSPLSSQPILLLKVIFDQCFTFLKKCKHKHILFLMYSK